MKYKRSLRFRLILSYFVLGLVLGSVLLSMLFISLEAIEEQLVNEHVLDELAYFYELTDQNKSITTLSTKKLRGYKLSKNTVAREYSFLQDLESGLHHIHDGQMEYVVGVKANSHFNYYMLYDVSSFAKQENYLISVFVIAVLAAVLGIVWYGYSISRQLIAPVTTLAGQVAGLPTTNYASSLSESYASDEVGELARTFDAYTARIGQFIEREQQFTSDASHELRTPLAVIQGAVELLLEHDELADTTRPALYRIKRAADNMQQTLLALLFLSRESDAVEIENGSSDISVIVKETANLAQSNLNKESINIVIVQNSEPKIAVPKSLIQVLLSNLIRNALNYSDSGQVTITVDNHQVTIEDSGIGIPEDDLPHIFERGYRASNAPEKGIGLGLSIVKRICDRFGWLLFVNSEPGKGTCVIWKFE